MKKKSGITIQIQLVLTKVKVKVDCDEQYEFWARLIVYGEGTATQPGNIIYEDNTLYFDKTGYHIIELNSPIALDDHNEIWTCNSTKR